MMLITDNPVLERFHVYNIVPGLNVPQSHQMLQVPRKNPPGANRRMTAIYVQYLDSIACASDHGVVYVFSRCSGGKVFKLDLRSPHPICSLAVCL